MEGDDGLLVETAVTPNGGQSQRGSRVIGSFIATDHLGTCPDGVQDFCVCRSEGDDPAGWLAEGDRTVQPIRQSDVRGWGGWTGRRLGRNSSRLRG